MGVGVVVQDTRQHHREGKEKVLFFRLLWIFITNIVKWCLHFNKI